MIHSMFLKKLFEEELKASAAGFPGAQDDLVTYTQIDLVTEKNDLEYEKIMINILLRKPQTPRNYSVKQSMHCTVKN